MVRASSASPARFNAGLLLVGLVACARPRAAPPRPADVSSEAVAFDGTVMTPSGEPLPDALVALVSVVGQDAREAGRARSDAAGHFHFQGLRPGRYALTATSSRDYAAAYVDARTLAPGERACGLALRMGPAGISFSGTLRDPRGNPLHGTVLGARLSQSEGDLFLAESSAAGRYRLSVPMADGYLVSAIAEGVSAPPQLLSAAQSRPLDMVLRREFPADEEAAPDVVAWMRSHALPLGDAQEPGGVAPLGAMIGMARVVAVGEATHGTREFNLLKLRLFQWLVEYAGFTVFALETGFTDALLANSYVLDGAGDPRRSVSALYGPWQTEEWVTLLEWMRGYNTKHARKLKFYGIDIQRPASTVQAVLTYLRAVDRDAEAPARASLAALSTPLRASHYEALPEARQNEVTAALAALEERFDLCRVEYIKKSDERRYELAREQLRILRASERIARHFEFAERDRAMAQVVAWLLQREGPDARALVSAHNGHVDGSNQDALGAQLRRAFGQDLLSVGLTFHEGSFMAWALPSQEGQGLSEFSVPAPPPGSVEATLARLRHPAVALDLRAVTRANDATARWMEAIHPMWSIGFAVDPAEARQPLSLMSRTPPAVAYDALVSIEKASAVRPIPGAWRSWRGSPPTLPEPTNLGVEDAGENGRPRAWWTPADGWTGGFRVSLDERLPHAGKRSVLVEAPSFAPPWASGEVWQRVDATPYRGKRVRVRAAVRIEGTAAVELLLELKRREPRRAEYESTLLETPVPPVWRDVEVTADVSGDTLSIGYGLGVSGQGRAWFDSVSIAPVN